MIERIHSEIEGRLEEVKSTPEYSVVRKTSSLFTIRCVAKSKNSIRLWIFMLSVSRCKRYRYLLSRARPNAQSL